MLTYKILPTEQAEEIYKRSFTQTNSAVLGYGEQTLLCTEYNIPLGWYLFTIHNNTIIETGIYVRTGYRNAGIGKQIVEQLIYYLDKKLGRGKYIFKSNVVTRKGIKIAEYRNNLTANPLEHQDHVNKVLEKTY